MTPSGRSEAADFGEKLRRAREQRGISLRQIAIATKISITTLEALERDDISRLPGGLFSRAFVRAYAQEVGLDPEQTVREFLARFPQEQLGHSLEHSREIEAEGEFESRRRAAGIVLRLVLISLPVAGLLVYLTLQNGGPSFDPSEPTPVQRRTQPAAPAAPVEQRPVAAVPSPEIQAPPVRGDGLQLTIRPTGPCWVSATVDGDVQFSALLGADEQRTLEAERSIELQIGDAGSFAYTLNGRPGRSLGASGQVVSVTITPQNLRQYVAP